MQAMEKQKAEIASLNHTLLEQNKSGFDSDARAKHLEQESQNLRDQLKDAELQMQQ